MCRTFHIPIKIIWFSRSQNFIKTHVPVALDEHSLWRFIITFLIDTSFTVCSGVSQGSIHGPLLFTVYINSILSAIHNSNLNLDTLKLLYFLLHLKTILKNRSHFNISCTVIHTELGKTGFTLLPKTGKKLQKAIVCRFIVRLSLCVLSWKRELNINEIACLHKRFIS